MPTSRYDSNIYIIPDPDRVNNLRDVFVSSVNTDLSKWKLSYDTSGSTKTYQSPAYNGYSFRVRIVIGSYGMIYMYYNGRYELILEWDKSNIPTHIYSIIEQLRKNVLSDDIKYLQATLGANPLGQRKSKLVQLEMNDLKEIIEKSLINWKSSPSKVLAEQIALTAKVYHNRNIPYTDWYKIFSEHEVVINEIKKLEDENDTTGD